MTKSWKITEMVIGVFQILWGILTLSLAIWSTKQIFDIGFEHLDYSWEDLSIPKIIKNYHYQLLLPILTIFAGLSIILNKRIGWITGVITSALLSTSMILSLWTIENKETENETQLYVFIGLISVIFITIFGLLLTKPIRAKYNPTERTWLIIGIIFTLLLLDNLFIK
jgi:uncharacterized membrane protein YidH (DUF202 family)